MTVRAFIVSPAAELEHRVGGLGLVERWRLSLSAHGVRDLEVIDSSQLPARLAATELPVVIVWAGWIAEHLAIESFVEHAGSVDDLELRTVAVTGASEVFPIVIAGRQLALRLAGLEPEAFANAGSVVRAVAERGLGKLNPQELAEGYSARVTDAESARRVTFRLIDRLRWRPGGLVAKYLNRPISTRISYLLVNTRVTANQTTLFAFLVGAVGIVFIFMGGYWNTVIGTGLMQANSVIDGIDGELARVRHQTSEFGSYLDSVCDEILNAALMIGVGYNLTTYVYGGNPLYLILGIFAGGVTFFYAVVHWHCRYRHGLGFYWWFEAYKPRREVQRSTSNWSYLKKLTMKESYLLLFLLGAIFGFLEVLLWIFAAVATLVVTLFIIHIPIKRARW